MYAVSLSRRLAPTRLACHMAKNLSARISAGGALYRLAGRYYAWK